MNNTLLHDQVATLLFLALLVIPLKAEHYILTVKQGSGIGVSPEHMGVGEYVMIAKLQMFFSPIPELLHVAQYAGFSAHQDSNYLVWLR